METLCIIREIYKAINDFELRFQARYGIGFNEGMLLCVLSKEGRCTSGEIARLLGVTPSNSSKVIASAESKGYIGRAVGEKDRRHMYFYLTEEGGNLLSTVECDSQSVDSILEQIGKL